MSNMTTYAGNKTFSEFDLNSFRLDRVFGFLNNYNFSSLYAGSIYLSVHTVLRQRLCSPPQEHGIGNVSLER